MLENPHGVIHKPCKGIQKRTIQKRRSRNAVTDREAVSGNEWKELTSSTENHLHGGEYAGQVSAPLEGLTYPVAYLTFRQAARQPSERSRELTNQNEY